ncbi:MAG: hypothetical protein AAGK22_19035 [Acidobacteriota bacterium]
MRPIHDIFATKSSWTPVALLAISAASLLLPGTIGAQQRDGFIHGTVTTESGEKYTGTLRWGKEEAFWDDLFNSNKEELPWLEEYGEAKGGKTLNVLGRKVKINWGNFGTGRQLVTRFGSLKSIENLGSDEVRLVFRGGEEIIGDGGSNDIGTRITVRDTTLGSVQLDWKRIEKIEFSNTPSGAEVGGYRLSGEVKTRRGSYRGFVQWDSEECLSTDKLDGESRDADHSIEMGKIRAIRRLSSKRSEVELKDGRKLRLEGTNDVDEDIRGILIEDSRYGRVEIGWDDFEEVVFDDQGSSGRAYDELDDEGPLRGRVVTRDGETLSGRLVYDLDEAYRWEMLDGNDGDIAYIIPFALVTEVEPDGDDAARVTLRSGEKLTLEGSHDTNEDNDGVLVLDGNEKDGTLVPWDQIASIRFDN